MEEYKISENAKSIILDNGIELTYCEFGDEHEDVIISGALYFHTFTPVLKEMAKKYHVYGVVMRMTKDDADTEFNDDGTLNWSRQWGKDIYDFAEKMNIKKFHYMSKCHGTNPGWYLFKEHPEMLLTLGSFYLAPHLCSRTKNQWYEIPRKEGQAGLLSRCIRHQERIPLKIAEVKTLGEGAKGGPETGAGDPTIGMYGESPELIWKTIDDCRKDLETTTVPVLLLFGTDDVLFGDHIDSNIIAMKIINRAKTVIIQGERHLMEMDCPERMASEALFFIDESRKQY